MNRVRQPIPTAIFVVLVGPALYSTLDLEQPRSGIVKIPVTSLESVRASMQR